MEKRENRQDIEPLSMKQRTKTWERNSPTSIVNLFGASMTLFSLNDVVLFDNKKNVESKNKRMQKKGTVT